jgi:hypothetical protein
MFTLKTGLVKLDGFSEKHHIVDNWIETEPGSKQLKGHRKNKGLETFIRIPSCLK